MLSALDAVGKRGAQEASVAVSPLQSLKDANDQAHAQTKLGATYAKGDGVPQDCAEAAKWFNLAAARLPISANNRGALVKALGLLTSMMKLAQVAAAQKLAREWKPK